MYPATKSQSKQLDFCSNNGAFPLNWENYVLYDNTSNSLSSLLNGGANSVKISKSIIVKNNIVYYKFPGDFDIVKEIVISNCRKNVVDTTLYVRNGNKYTTLCVQR